MKFSRLEALPDTAQTPQPAINPPGETSQPLDEQAHPSPSPATPDLPSQERSTAATASQAEALSNGLHDAAVATQCSKAAAPRLSETHPLQQLQTSSDLYSLLSGRGPHGDPSASQPQRPFSAHSEGQAAGSAAVRWADDVLLGPSEGSPSGEAPEGHQSGPSSRPANGPPLHVGGVKVDAFVSIGDMISPESAAAVPQNEGHHVAMTGPGNPPRMASLLSVGPDADNRHVLYSSCFCIACLTAWPSCCVTPK
jgi:hypothetical protein